MHQEQIFVVTQTGRAEWGEDLKVQVADSAQNVDWVVIEGSEELGSPLIREKATPAAVKRTQKESATLQYYATVGRTMFWKGRAKLALIETIFSLHLRRSLFAISLQVNSPLSRESR